MVWRWRKGGWQTGNAACREPEVGGKGGMCGLRKKVSRRGRACVECTSNISLMSVTLDVSKLRDRLNASASCAESKGSHEKEGGMWTGRRGCWATEGLRGTHMKHLAHISDAGRIENQRLVKCPRLLRRVKGES